MDDRDRQNLTAGIAVAILIALALWLMHAMSEGIRKQDCVLSGRRNCDPIETDQ